MRVFGCFLFFFVFLGILVGCQAPTKVSEKDQGLEGRVFSKLEYGKPKELKHAVIVDVRSQFEHQMSRPPRSFHAFWKDWDLRGFQGERLEKKRKDLQRLLSLNGVDPLTQVVILGKGLKGQGEEFLVATTLISLGVNRIGFLNESQAKEALTARNLPKVENLPYWDKPLQGNFTCEMSGQDEGKLKKKADVLVEGSPQQYFKKNLEIKKTSYPKSLKLNVYSPGSLWSFGVGLHLKEQGRQVCVF